MKKLKYILVLPAILLLVSCSSKTVTPQAKPQKIKITLDYNYEQTQATVKEIDKNTIFPEPENPTRNKYGFIGWYAKKDGSGDAFDWSKPITESLTLYAKWVLNLPLETKRHTNLLTLGKFDSDCQPYPPDNTPYTKFDFATNSIVDENSDHWDIAFRRTQILVNGGSKVSDRDTAEPKRTGNAAAYLYKGSFELLKEADTKKMKADGPAGTSIIQVSMEGWYEYTGGGAQTGELLHLILPLKDRVLVFRTRDRKYVKMVVESYYKDNDTKNLCVSGQYTFKYVYQPNGSTSLE